MTGVTEYNDAPMMQGVSTIPQAQTPRNLFASAATANGQYASAAVPDMAPAAQKSSPISYASGQLAGDSLRGVTGINIRKESDVGFAAGQMASAVTGLIDAVTGPSQDERTPSFFSPLPGMKQAAKPALPTPFGL